MLFLLCVRNFLFALCFISTIFTLILIIFPIFNDYERSPNIHFIENTSVTTDDKNNIILETFHKYYRINWTKIEKKIKYELPSSGERLWFLTNGTVKPDRNVSQHLALWPNEGDVEDDRIINQLMYEPFDYSPQTAKRKTIYVKTFDNYWGNLIGSEYFSRCPVNSCTFVEKTEAKFADLIFLKGVWPSFQFNRSSNQIWLYYNIESALSVPYVNAKLNHQINWTATYRHDSDIPTPYAKYYPFSSNETRIARNTNYAANKTKLIAWFVSHCNTSNKRLQYALELRKYIRVDIYGECGELKCSRLDSNRCNQMLGNVYKFYLAFENSNCFDYITEKFWFTALGNGVVPIVMGAESRSYKRFAPPNSFIHINDFGSPKHLADYISYLDANDSAYNKYFEWKQRGEVRGVMMWCRICALLHSNIPYKTYTNISEWWSPKNSCYK